MVKIEAYHRKQTQPHSGGQYFFRCVDCKQMAEVFCLEACTDFNKYLNSGLCPRCFEVALEAKLREGVDGAQKRQECPGCGGIGQDTGGSRGDASIYKCGLCRVLEYLVYPYDL